MKCPITKEACMCEECEWWTSNSGSSQGMCVVWAIYQSMD